MSVYYIIIGAVGDQGLHTRTACSGQCASTHYSQYSMECPVGQKIAIDSQKLEYRWKHSSANCPNTIATCRQHERCCNQSFTDCTTRFTDNQVYQLYQRCSGRQQCGWMEAEALDTNDCSSHSDNMYFVSASYTCVDGLYIDY